MSSQVCCKAYSASVEVVLICSKYSTDTESEELRVRELSTSIELMLAKIIKL
jgi:hypothetical protein